MNYFLTNISYLITIKCTKNARFVSANVSRLHLNVGVVVSIVANINVIMGVHMIIVRMTSLWIVLLQKKLKPFKK
jgi:hypothetical protein